MNLLPAITPPPLNPGLWLRRHFVAFVILFAALVTIADGSLPRAETHRIEEPCGIALIGACLPRRVAGWEQAQGAGVEATQGFTLLELAIVLTVIGLIVGGILWGADMIGAATTRAQISQVEKFNAAANTFVTKYGYLPGDIPDPYASQFGLKARGNSTGQGDGNGILEGWNAAGWIPGIGETAMFWEDLNTVGFIEGAFSAASPNTGTSSDITGTNIGLYFPAAKLGNGNYVYVWSTSNSGGYASDYPGNYFGISAVSVILNASQYGKISSTPHISVAQAYAIDKKIDDGLPLSGIVQSIGVSNDPYWSATNYWVGQTGFDTDILYRPYPSVNNISGSTITCFDNAGSASNTTQYSMEISNGSNPNCALSFRMQGAAR